MKNINLKNNALFNYRDRELSIEIDRQRKADAILYYNKSKNRLTTRPCPVCGDFSFKLIDRYNGSFPIVRCSSCTTVYVNEVLGNSELAEYYESSKSSLMLNKFYKHRNQIAKNSVNSFRLTRGLELILQQKKQTVRILEIGCGDGSFLESLKRELDYKNINVEAYGIDTNAEELVSAELRGISVKNTFAETLDGIYSNNLKFDAIFFFELIEHLVSPFEFLKSMHNISSEKCVYTFSTPNSLGLENRITDYNGYRLLAHAIAPPAHINAFNVSNITHLLLRCQFMLESFETQGQFDAWAALDYLQNAPLSDLKISDINFINEDNAVKVQELINFLNASSAMHVTFRNFK